MSSKASFISASCVRTRRKAEMRYTGKEFDLLLFLASNNGRVFTKKQIYSQVWEEEYAFDDSNIMSFISKLRKKIEPDPDHPFYILTVRGYHIFQRYAIYVYRKGI